ncbi:MAG: glycosyltransferase family 4 protein [Planctomycetota bacterium]|nr:MAG: glycosyltransferase family 4 protein [Planctomycetota bacterium]
MGRVLFFSNFVSSSKKRPIMIPCQHTKHVYDIIGPGRWRIDPSSTYSKKKRLGIKEILLLLIACGKVWIRSISRYDVLITSGCWTVLLLGGYSYVMKGKRKLVAASFNVPKRRHRLWRVLTRLLIRKIDIIYVHSKYDIGLINSLYGFPQSKIRFYPLVRPKPQQGKSLDEYRFSDSREYIISFGGSGRDYKTFFEAISGTDLSALVVASKRNLKGLAIPDNVKVLYNIPLEECDKLVDECKFAVFALDGSEPSCGQTCIVTSLMLGKPVICTDWVGTRDYITEGKNGLLVQIRNPVELKEKMLKLANDSDLYKTLSTGAIQWATEYTDPFKVQSHIDMTVTQVLNE